MDENNRITITVCGDGGCGTHAQQERRSSQSTEELMCAQERVQSHYGW